MAENEGDGGGGGKGGAAAGGRVGAPPRPTITLPPRSAYESLFQAGSGGYCGAGGGASEVSPGPLTLVSSFFADDPDSECRSFTQLLVGAMNSPAARRTTGFGAGEEQQQQKKAAETSSGGGGGAPEIERVASGGGAEESLRWGQNRPPSLVVSQPQMFMVPPGLSPASLLDSPAFFSSALGSFGMSHQEALAQVTAQAALSPFRMLSQGGFSPSLFASTTTAKQPTQEVPTSQQNISIPESPDGSPSDQRPQPSAVIMDKPADDGYNWRKYGQKMVKGSEFPRSYYKCTHTSCPVKKKIERSLDGQVTEIIYKGQHNHQRPTPNKRAKEGGSLINGLNEVDGNLDNAKIQPDSLVYHESLNKTKDKASSPIISRRETESSYRTEQSGSSDSEEATAAKTDAADDIEPDNKRRNISSSTQRTLAEPRIIVQTTSEVDLLDDGFRWRKYGQKVVKGNPNPRSYYKCTYAGCNVRKHIERSSTDPKAVITTYEGKHNHDVPVARGSSHSTASTGAALSRSTRPVAVLQLKEEHEIT